MVPALGAEETEFAGFPCAQVTLWKILDVTYILTDTVLFRVIWSRYCLLSVYINVYTFRCDSSSFEFLLGWEKHVVALHPLQIILYTYETIYSTIKAHIASA